MPQYSKTELRAIYDRTSGYCHLCGEKMAFTNYGQHGERGAWEIEHSNPKARGGTDRANNLYAACIDCNRSKGDGSTRSVRQGNGLRRAPLSRQAVADKKAANTAVGGGLGLVVGAMAGGPVGAAVGAVIGGAIGNSIRPK